jgi:hypothetical protein
MRRSKRGWEILSQVGEQSREGGVARDSFTRGAFLRRLTVSRIAEVWNGLIYKNTHDHFGGVEPLGLARLYPLLPA